MPSALLQLLYTGDRRGAEALAIRESRLDIFEASALGVLEALVERIEEEPASIGSYSDDGWTPLHFAAYFGNTACLKELMRRGAPIDAHARNGSAVTPLHSACAGNHTAEALALIAAGADVNAEQHGGYRPLDSAGQNGNEEIAAALRLAGGTHRGGESP